MHVVLVNPRQAMNDASIPWGALAVGTWLRHQGVAVTLLDASMLGIDDTLTRLAELLPEADLVGVSAMSSDTPFLKTACDLVKSLRPACPVIVGGPHAILRPEDTCRYPAIDFVAYGEGEATTAALVQQLAREQPDFSRVPGLLYKDADGNIRRTPPAEPVPTLDMDFNLLDPRVREGFRRYAAVLTGRGCSFKCTFCYNVVAKQRWRGRSAEEIVAELIPLVTHYDPPFILMRDDLFFHDKKRVERFLELYREKAFRFHWSASVRAVDFREKFVNQELVAELAACGCRELRIGVESGSDRVLKAIKKGIRVQNVRTMVETMAVFPQIRLLCGFMIGLPPETFDDYRATLDLIAWMKAQAPNLEVKGPYAYRIYPGGELFDEIVANHPQFSVPDSLAGWAERFQLGGQSAGEFDRNQVYPWIPDEHRTLVKKAHRLYELAYHSLRGAPAAKQFLLIPFCVLARWRFRLGWYGHLVDLRLAEGILRFSPYRMITSHAWYPALERRPWFATLKRQPLMRYLRDGVVEFSR